MVSRWDGPIYRIDVLYLVQDGYTQGARLYRRLDQTADGIPCQVGILQRTGITWYIQCGGKKITVVYIPYPGCGYLIELDGTVRYIRALEAANG